MPEFYGGDYHFSKEEIANMSWAEQDALASRTTIYGTAIISHQEHDDLRTGRLQPQSSSQSSASSSAQVASYACAWNSLLEERNREHMKEVKRHRRISETAWLLCLAAENGTFYRFNPTKETLAISHRKADPHAPLRSGTPVHFAAFHGHLRHIQKRLLTEKLLLQPNNEGQTPFAIAKTSGRYGQVADVKDLLAKVNRSRTVFSIIRDACFRFLV